MDESNQAVWIGVGGVLATLMGAWWGAKISRDAARDLFVRSKRAEFAAAFVEELVKLETATPEPGECIAHTVLQSGYEKHLAAYWKLRSVLDASQTRLLDDAWRRYLKNDSSLDPVEAGFCRFAYVLAPRDVLDQNRLAVKHIKMLLAAVNNAA